MIVLTMELVSMTVIMVKMQEWSVPHKVGYHCCFDAVHYTFVTKLCVSRAI